MLFFFLQRTYKYNKNNKANNNVLFSFSNLKTGQIELLIMKYEANIGWKDYAKILNHLINK